MAANLSGAHETGSHMSSRLNGRDAIIHHRAQFSPPRSSARIADFMWNALLEACAHQHTSRLAGEFNATSKPSGRDDVCGDLSLLSDEKN